MAHIAIDARIINTSTGRYVERLVTYLQEVDSKNEYSIIVPEKDKDFWKPKAKNFTVRTVKYENYSFGEQLGFNRYLKKLNADLVHFCMPQQPINYKGKKVTTFHDLTLLKTYNSDKNWLVFHAKQKVAKFVFRKSAEDSDAVITVSDYTTQDLLKFFANVNKDTIHRIYEASDVSNIPPKKYYLPFTKYLLYVGQQSDYKNIKRLGDAHHLISTKYPTLGLVLVGKKNLAVLNNEKYFKERGYNNVLFTDFVSDAELSWLYSNAQAYVFPSLMEGFGLPGLEAMGYGTPVISSKATCLPEVYGQAAHYFDPHDTSDIAEAIDQVLSNDKIRTRLARNGYKQIKKYSWKKMAQETHDVYKQVLGLK